MKKWYLLAIMVLLVPAVSFGGEQIRAKGGIQAKGFGDFELSFEQAHVCSVQSADSGTCDIPEKLVFGTAVLHIVVFVPQTQGYTRHYIVSDPAGTFASYFTSHSFLDAGFQTIELDQPLPAGDYVFTAVLAGDNGIAAIGDQYRFSVR
jgi:hypothetical protein